MTARLRGWGVAALLGYSIAWADRAYGHAPVGILLLIAGLAWTAGWMTAAVPLTEATAQAQRERDDVAARVAQLEDGGTYTPIPLDTARARAMAAHPSNLRRVQR